MRLLVCGGRDYSDRKRIRSVLQEGMATAELSLVITGGARGADTLADDCAQELGLDRIVFPANWAKHGRAAGHIRNQRMLDEGRPDAVLAFPGGRGTADMVRRAETAGLRVYKSGS